jgi:hypothetical protein
MLETYLAAFTGMDAIMETGSFVTAYPAEDCGTVKFWNQRKRQTISKRYRKKGTTKEKLKELTFRKSSPWHFILQMNYEIINKTLLKFLFPYKL